MEKFFFIGSQIDEVRLKDLLLSRYHTLDFDVEVEEFCQLIMLAIEEKNKETKRQEWLALLPLMATAGKYKSCEEYYESVSGKNIDLRSTEEIIAEIDAAHERAKNGT